MKTRCSNRGVRSDDTWWPFFWWVNLHLVIHFVGFWNVGEDVLGRVQARFPYATGVLFTPHEQEKFRCPLETLVVAETAAPSS